MLAAAVLLGVGVMYRATQKAYAPQGILGAAGMLQQCNRIEQDRAASTPLAALRCLYGSWLHVRAALGSRGSTILNAKYPARHRRLSNRTLV